MSQTARNASSRPRDPDLDDLQVARALHIGLGMQAIDKLSLAQVTGGTGGAPLSGDVNQQINTNWGGTQIINPAPQRPSPLRFEQLRQNPELRHGPPPYVNRPIRRR